jgi:hypothetical protein
LLLSSFSGTSKLSRVSGATYRGAVRESTLAAPETLLMTVINNHSSLSQFYSFLTKTILPTVNLLKYFKILCSAAALEPASGRRSTARYILYRRREKYRHRKKYRQSTFRRYFRTLQKTCSTFSFRIMYFGMLKSEY